MAQLIFSAMHKQSFMYRKPWKSYTSRKADTEKNQYKAWEWKKEVK